MAAICASNPLDRQADVVAVTHDQHIAGRGAGVKGRTYSLNAVKTSSAAACRRSRRPCGQASQAVKNLGDRDRSREQLARGLRGHPATTAADGGARISSDATLVSKMIINGTVPPAARLPAAEGRVRRP